MPPAAQPAQPAQPAHGAPVGPPAAAAGEFAPHPPSNRLQALRRGARWPGLCAVCHGWCRGALCSPCLDRFAGPRLRCGRCGLGLAAPAPACGECLADPPPFENGVCALDYAFPWDRLILAFKFNQRAELAAPLAGLLAEAADAAIAAGAVQRPDLLLPVPLTPARLRQRGYNQAWELARRCGRALGIETRVDALQRHDDTASQATLGRAERLRNLRSAFDAPAAARPALAGLRVALIDDVMTTGATARAAAAALRAGGAATVDLWVLARTPAPGG
jgi:ComF family protein